ncbi:MAG: hypothetical protein PHT50_05625 [Candidatus Omnitrophica bacterium]|nr:hypothetical protein [Candidatus Omnitrophota bacterium]
MGFPLIIPRRMRKAPLLRKILLFLCLNLLVNFSFCYAERVKSYRRSDGSIVSWYKRCDSVGNVREDYSYEVGR